jgi:hypothetical protein
MSSDEKGVWKVYVALPPGRYQYKFVIDQVRWEKDPNNPDVAQEGGFENSFVVVPEGVKYDVPFISLTTALEAVAGRRQPATRWTSNSRWTPRRQRTCSSPGPSTTG